MDIIFDNNRVRRACKNATGKLKRRLDDLSDYIRAKLREKDLTGFLDMTPKERADFIVKRACKYWGIDHDELIRKSRKDNIVMRRQMVIKLLRENTTLNLKEIAPFVGYKTHHVIIYHSKEINHSLSNEVYGNSEYRRMWKGLNDYLNERVASVSKAEYTYYTESNSSSSVG